MKRLSIYLLFVVALVAAGCGDDDEQSTAVLKPGEAKVSMDKMSTDMTGDIVGITQAEGVEAIGDLFSLTELSDPFSGRIEDGKAARVWLKNHASEFKSIFISEKVGFARTAEEGFDFNGNKGVYDWNASTEQFEKTTTGGNIIEINFPAAESATNNVKLQITAYAEQAFEDEFDFYYMPTSLSANLSVDNVKQVEITFSAEYNQDGVPVSGNVSLFLNPYTFAIGFDDTSATRVTGSVSIKEGTTTIVAASTTINFADADKETVNTASGFVQYRNVKIQGDIDAEGYETANNPDINDYVNLALYDGNSKIGDIVFVVEMVDGYEEDVPYVQYADGSKEKLEDILQPVIDKLEAFSDDVESWG